MNTQRSISRAPVLVEVIEGKRYFWCTCDLSITQPFCDGSHQDSNLKPLVFLATQTTNVRFCRCKQTASPPLCDGTHKHLNT
ncbi:CDGSH iron-sulfur domain-containing protein [Aestuariirhabdus sp. Z084]|uniref:CDGSH iron-sulfur domain-containing protein n=1 Tax=Aestuariirhabdus haliotis TaxID=2918751 RepID=UPI0020BE01BC|nr:CDGSH iron-sulfur domain-containing protein [Aestuariirhabdus haliotis]MCL6416673.1 CDGSH iron-sulfur domain-containing protein [Aestuariirhabdus haliotis]